MLVPMLRLHGKWFALFATMALISTLFGGVPGGVANIANGAFWLSMWPTLLACLGLAIIVPWAMFFIDPRRGESLSLSGFLRYWKAL